MSMPIAFAGAGLYNKTTRRRTKIIEGAWCPILKEIDHLYI